jgi:transcriptional regulator with PAS, ATPase and Fis domain
MLVEYFVKRYADKARKQISKIDKDTLMLCQSYHWPGNIRELQNIVERSVILLHRGYVFGSMRLGFQARTHVARGHQVLSHRLSRPMKRNSSRRLSRRVKGKLLG